MHALERTWADDLSRQNVNAQPPIIQVFNVDNSTGQSGEEVDLGMVNKIVTLALESGMWLLLDLELDVSWLHARQLVTLALEINLVAILNTPVHVNVKNLPLNDSLLGVTLSALVLLLDRLTLSSTVWADGLEALNHRTHLAHHRLHTLTITASALLDGTILSSLSIALRAKDRLLQSQLRDLAAVDVLEGYLHDVVDGASLWWASLLTTAEHVSKTAATATEELGEEVLGTHATWSTCAAAFETLLSILVIDLALLWVTQDAVCVGDLLEFLSGVWVVLVLIFTRSACVHLHCYEASNVPGWCLRAATLYAFFSSASVQP